MGVNITLHLTVKASCFLESLCANIQQLQLKERKIINELSWWMHHRTASKLPGIIKKISSSYQNIQIDLKSERCRNFTNSVLSLIFFSMKKITFFVRKRWEFLFCLSKYKYVFMLCWLRSEWSPAAALPQMQTAPCRAEGTGSERWAGIADWTSAASPCAECRVNATPPSSGTAAGRNTEGWASARSDVEEWWEHIVWLYLVHQTLLVVPLKNMAESRLHIPLHSLNSASVLQTRTVCTGRRH